MSTVASLVTKEEIKRQRIRANTAANGRPYTFCHFLLQFYLITMAQEQKLLTSLTNNVEGRWLGNIYEHFSLKSLNVCVEISFVNIDERL